MAIFGDIERLLADLYPYRWVIAAVILLILAGVVFVGYRQGWHLALWRRRVKVAIVGIPGLAVIITAGVWLGSPLFTNTTVDEAFPPASQAVVPTDMTRSDVEKVMADMAKQDHPMTEPMPASIAVKGSDTGAAAGTQGPGAAQVVSSGDFRDADSFHKGSGIAKIYRASDGSHFLRLENFKATNGPDLHVVLSPEPNPDSSKQVKSPGYVDLGKLKGNIGNQNYPIPEGINVAAQSSVVIYCKPFEVVFSVATLGTSG